jgi:protein gp37
MGKTKIAWASQVCNVITGCSKPAAAPQAAFDLDPELFDQIYPAGIPEKWRKPGTSPECVRCYAEDLSLRREWSETPWTEADEDRNVKLKPERMKEFARIAVDPITLPPSQRKRFFVCSMGDIFHRLVPNSILFELFRAMKKSPHIYMLLTKRPDRACEFGEDLGLGLYGTPENDWPDNVWLGTTCGHPITKWRIEYLRRSRAAVRFLSMEPLLASMLPIDLSGIDQVIVGGESGAGFRPMKMEWARELRDAAREAGTAFFFKQDSSYRAGARPYLIETNGVLHEYHQFPGELTAPVEVGSAKPEDFPLL